jgi:aerobic-type carbon monoxide dehydrogenase small subunit (CoxS/CutS family)
MATVQFKLNGKSVAFTGDVERMLLWALRTDLALTAPDMQVARGCEVPARITKATKNNSG